MKNLSSSFDDRNISCVGAFIATRRTFKQGWLIVMDHNIDRPTQPVVEMRITDPKKSAFYVVHMFINRWTNGWSFHTPLRVMPRLSYSFTKMLFVVLKLALVSIIAFPAKLLNIDLYSLWNNPQGVTLPSYRPLTVSTAVQMASFGGSSGLRARRGGAEDAHRSRRRPKGGASLPGVGGQSRRRQTNREKGQGHQQERMAVLSKTNRSRD